MPAVLSCRPPCCPGRAQCGRCTGPEPPRVVQTILQEGCQHLEVKTALTHCAGGLTQVQEQTMHVHKKKELQLQQLACLSELGA